MVLADDHSLVRRALRRLLDGEEGIGGLSGREAEVLWLTGLGYTGAEVVSKLHISRRTVDTHRANIHAKLGLRTRAELVDYALGHGLIGGG